MTKALFLPSVLVLFGVGAAALALTGGLDSKAPASFVQGEMDATRIDIAAKISARVGALGVRDGSPVAKGDLLVALDSPETEERVRQAKENVQAATAALEKLLQGTREESIRRLHGLWRESVAALKLAEATHLRTQGMLKSNAVSRQRYDEATSALLQARAKEVQTKAALDEAVNGARAEDVEAARAGLLEAKARLCEISATARDLRLLSPVDGEVDKVVMRRGEFANAGYPLVSLVDLSDQWAVVLLREDQLAKVRMGDRFEGSVPALGGKKVVFEVDYISPLGAFATWRATNTAGSFDLKTFEVHGRPAARVDGLRPGMSVVFEPGSLVQGGEKASPSLKAPAAQKAQAARKPFEG